MKHVSSINYRPDIDGLRALAVLLVVSFHAFPMWVKGGFIGVDIFFVISGYLISSIILKDIQNGKFFLSIFYERRIKRILPSLIVVLISTLILGRLFLVQEDFLRLTKHIAGGSTFISNFLLLSESGYFDDAAYSKPLLHLWSLAIEEQFYLFCPFFFMIFSKFRFGLSILIFTIFTLSFWLNIYSSSMTPFFAFYSPLTRVWELLIGVILAYCTLNKIKLIKEMKLTTIYQSEFYNKIIHKKNIIINLLSFFGLILILIGVVSINKESKFPGWLAIYPTLGTAMIILSGTSTIINRYVLSNKIAVWIGLISYPLYLWHWPLLSFMWIFNIEYDPSRNIRILTVIISFFLAFLTYKYIEKPIRYIDFSNKRIVSVLIIILVGLGLYGSGVYYGIIKGVFGSPNVFVLNKGGIGYSEFGKYYDENFYSCFSADFFEKQGKSLYRNDKDTNCVQSQRAGKTEIVIIGDSHAQQLLAGLSQQLKYSNVMYIDSWPLPEVENGKILNSYFNWIIQQSNVQYIIISAYWPIRAQQSPKMWQRLNKVVEVLSATGKTVFIANDVPSFSFDPKDCKYSGWLYSGVCNESYSAVMKRYQLAHHEIQKIVSVNKNTQVLNSMKYFCSSNICSMAKDGHLFFRDKHHLNLDGSMYLGKQLKSEIFPFLLPHEKSEELPFSKHSALNIKEHEQFSR